MPPLPPQLRETFTRYTAGPTLVRQAITGADAGALNRPGGDGWSARNVVVHLADAEIVEAFRLRALLAGTPAVLPAIDADQWRRSLSYLWRDAEAALALFQLLRYANAELFQHADREAWGRTSGTEPATIADILRQGAAHSDEHVAQLERLVLG